MKMESMAQVEKSESDAGRVNCCAAESGLASCLVGSTVLLLAAMIAILATLMWAHADRSPATVLLHAWIARLAVGIPFLLVALGTWCGIGALRNSIRRRLSPALPLAGLSLNIAAMGSWILSSIALLNTTESLLVLSR